MQHDDSLVIMERELANCWARLKKVERAAIVGLRRSILLGNTDLLSRYVQYVQFVLSIVRDTVRDAPPGDCPASKRAKTETSPKKTASACTVVTIEGGVISAARQDSSSEATSPRRQD
jgi:hypothetical protein